MNSVIMFHDSLTKSSLSISGAVVPGPPGIPKSSDA